MTYRSKYIWQYIKSYKNNGTNSKGSRMKVRRSAKVIELKD